LSRASQLEDAMRRIEGVGVPVFVTAEDDLDGVFDTIERVAELLGDPENGRRVTSKLRSRTEVVRERVQPLAPVSVFVMVGDRPLITTGRGTFLDDLIRRAGGRSISENETAEWPQYS